MRGHLKKYKIKENKMFDKSAIGIKMYNNTRALYLAILLLIEFARVSFTNTIDTINFIEMRRNKVVSKSRIALLIEEAITQSVCECFRSGRDPLSA